LGPIGKGPFAARGASPGQDGGEERLPDRQSIADLDAGRGERRVDAGGQVEFGGEVVEGGDGAGADGGDLEGGGVLALVELQDVIDATEVSEHANGGFSVLAKGLDDAEVSDAVGLVGVT
jgi:hypothetical protein